MKTSNFYMRNFFMLFCAALLSYCQPTSGSADGGIDMGELVVDAAVAVDSPMYRHHIIFITSKPYPGYDFGNRRDICFSIAQSSDLESVKSVREWAAWLSYYDANNTPMESSGSAINWLIERIKVANPELTTDPIGIGSWYSTNPNQKDEVVFRNLYTFRSGPRVGVVYDERGIAVPTKDAPVWTGTRLDGTAAPVLELCPDLALFSPNSLSSWSGRDNGPKGRIGTAGRISSDWTDSGLQFCNVPAHLYCISIKL